MVLTAASYSPRRSGFLVTVAGGKTSANLTPASRRQDHTTWPSASSAHLVKSATRVHRIPSRVRDDRDTPLHGDGTVRVVEVIWVKKEAENFCGQHWTGRIELIPRKNFSSSVIPNCHSGAPQKPGSTSRRAAACPPKPKKECSKSFRCSPISARAPNCRTSRPAQRASCRFPP